MQNALPPKPFFSPVSAPLAEGVLLATAMRVPARVLVLFAHPALQKSRINRHLVTAAQGLDGVTFHDLYEAYPDLHVDVAREQHLLVGHDTVVLQYPFYWYSCPALLKEWLDVVLEYGFAYGRDGDKLRGKRLVSAITTGGPGEAYGRAGQNHFTMGELLAPFEQTARLCGMKWLPPFVIHGSAHGPDAPALATHAAAYGKFLAGLRDEVHATSA